MAIKRNVGKQLTLEMAMKLLSLNVAVIVNDGHYVSVESNKEV